MKLVPTMVTLVAAAPATALFGVTDVMVGPLTVKVLAAEVAELPFLTVTLNVPAVTMDVAGTVAVIDVAVPAVTVSCVAPKNTVDPAVKLPLVSVVPGRKPVPAMVIFVAAAPATTVAGVKDVILGALTVRVLAPEAAVLVFFTTRLSVPAAAMLLAGSVTVMDVAVPAVATNGVVLEPT